MSIPYRFYLIRFSVFKAFLISVCSVAVIYTAVSEAFFRFDREPSRLPIPEITEEEEAALTILSTALQGVITTRAPLSIRLSGQQLNAWLALSRNEYLRLIGEHSRISIRGGLFYVDISLPLELFGYRGRYFNGHAVLEAEQKGGVLRLTLQELSSASSSHASGIALALGLLYKNSLDDLLQLSLIIPQELRDRCTAHVLADTLHLECT